MRIVGCKKGVSIVWAHPSESWLVACKIGAVKPRHFHPASISFHAFSSNNLLFYIRVGRHLFFIGIERKFPLAIIRKGSISFVLRTACRPFLSWNSAFSSVLSCPPPLLSFNHVKTKNSTYNSNLPWLLFYNTRFFLGKLEWKDQKNKQKSRPASVLGAHR